MHGSPLRGSCSKEAPREGVGAKETWAEKKADNVWILSVGFLNLLGFGEFVGLRLKSSSHCAHPALHASHLTFPTFPLRMASKYASLSMRYGIVEADHARARARLAQLA